MPDCTLAAPGDVLTGEYVLIFNSDLSDATENSAGDYVDLPQKSGTIYFDDAASALTGVSAAASFNASAPAASSGHLESVGKAYLSAAPAYAPGQVKAIGSSGKSFTLSAIGSHCLIWMDDTIKNGYLAAGEDIYAVGSAAAAVYDEKSYPIVARFDAQSILDYADGSGKLSILLEAGISSGYFNSYDRYSDYGGVTAIHIKGSSLPTDFEGFGPLFAHECQHAVSYCLQLSQDNYQFMELWMNEALSVAAMDAYTKGHDGNGWLNGLVESSDYLRAGGSFIYSSYPGYTEANYSMPFLFLRYLNTQAKGGYDYQSDFYSKFYQAPAATLGSVSSTPWRRYDANRVEYILRQYAATADWDFKEALINFYIAIQTQASQGVYGFYGDPVIARKISGFPLYNGASGSSVDIEKCGAIMVKTLNGSFAVPADAGADIVFVAFSPSAYEKNRLQTAGTADDPHLIHNAETLSYIWDAAYREDHFRVTADFEADAGYYDFWENTFYNYNMPEARRHWPDFYGVLDGGGHSITGLKHPICKNNYGLIRNLEVACELTAHDQILGALACTNYGTIENCSVHGSITLPNTVNTPNNYYSWIGGVAGDMRSGNVQARFPARISRCMSDVAIRGRLDMYKYFYIGGVVGSSYVSSGVDIDNCYSAATLDLNIEKNLPGAVVLGGLAGDNSTALTKNCYSVASVGFTNNNSGDMSDKLFIGRMFGRANSYGGTYQSLYALDGLSSCGGSYTPEEIVSQSASYMQTAAGYPGFDFSALWEMPSPDAAYRYPLLRKALAIPGDVSQDGVVTLADAVLICRHIAGLAPLPAPLAALADVTGNGVVAVDDLLRVCRYIAGTLERLTA